MAELRLKHMEQADIDTVLAEDIQFDGELSFEKPLMIKGKFTGIISASDDLYIDRNAVVEAKIDASRVSIRGSVKGNVRARKRLELFASSALEGDVLTPDLIMESGCRFNGTCRMQDETGTGEERR